MADGPNIGYATLSLIPSLRGSEGILAKIAADAGTKSGGLFSGSFAAALKGQAGSALKAHLGSIATAGLAGAAVGIGIGLVKIGDQFDTQFDKIRAGTGATGKTLSSLEGSFKTVFSHTATDMASTGTAIEVLNQKLGLTGKPLETLAKQFLNLSHITNTDLGTNVANVTSLFNNFGVRTKDQSKALDILFRTSQKTGISVADLAAQGAQGGAQLRKAGLDFASAAALVGSLSKAGLSVSEILPGLNRGIAQAAKHGVDAGTFLKQTFDTIKNGSQQVADNKALEVFGQRGLKMGLLIREGKLDYQKLLEVISHGKDTIGRSTKDTEDFGESWTKLKNSAFTTLEPIATKLFNAITKGMDYLVTHKAAMAAVLTVLTAGFAALAIAAGAAAISLIAAEAPIIAAVAAAALLGTGLVLLVTHFGEVIGFLRDHWKGILEILTGPFGLAVVFIVNHFDTIKSGVQTAVRDIAGFGKDMWGWITSGLSGLVNGALGLIEDLVNGVIIAINAAIRAYNLLPGHKDIATIGHVDLNHSNKPKATVAKGPSHGTLGALGFASGGVVRAINGGVFANIGEGRYDEAVLANSPQSLAPFAATLASQLGGGQDRPIVLSVAPGAEGDLLRLLAKWLRVDPASAQQIGRLVA